MAIRISRTVRVIASMLTRLGQTFREQTGSDVLAKNLVLAFALVVFAFGATDAQKRAQPSQPVATPVTSREEPWWAAQRNIESAIQRLEAYLRESPNGNRAATARQQLAALRNLAVTASRPEWVKMYSLPLPDFPDWRIAAVDAQAERTTLNIEIRCEREDGSDCRFARFDHAPLVLVDNNGQYYSMLRSAALPPDVKYKAEGQAVISSGRILSISVEFAPLLPGAISGQVYYRDRNEARPARFSLIPPAKKED